MVASLFQSSRRSSVDNPPSWKTSERIPQTLQTIFVIANRGKEVNKPPPNRVAQRTFRRFFFKRSKDNAESVNRNTETDDSSYESNSLEFEVPKAPSCSALQCSPSSPQPSTKHHISPQVYVTSLLKNRGYSVTTYKSLETGYYNKPTPLQVASYGTKVIETIRANNAKFFKEILDVGLSPNACNEHGESMVHMICRMGHLDLFQILLEHGCTVQVSDDYGRTPLHDACWSTHVNFELVDLILERDPRLLFVQDSRGSVPLQYLPETQWTAWTKFFMSRKDRFWPERCILKHGMQSDAELSMVEPNTRPVPNPKNASPLEVAKLVAQGRMSPMEAIILKDDHLENSSGSDGSESDDSDSEYDSESDRDEESQGSDDDEDDDSDNWSESTFDDKEMEEILGSLGKGKVIAWSS